VTTAGLKSFLLSTIVVFLVDIKKAGEPKLSLTRL